MAITASELVSYLRDPAATEDNVALVVDLANGLVSDELQDSRWITDDWPTWVTILALDIAEAGWQKFAEESVDDWSGKRRAALSAMTLGDTDRARLVDLDGRSARSSAYTVKTYSPLDLP